MVALSSRTCLSFGFILFFHVVFLVQGCQPAGRYQTHGKPKKEIVPVEQVKKEEPPVPVPQELGWLPDRGSTPSVAIEVVHPSTNPQKWKDLSGRILHLPPLMHPAGAVSAVGLDTWASLAVTATLAAQPVYLRIPAGLPDPAKAIPKENPLTYSKWVLGRRLFFDSSWLTSSAGISCASCHKPDHSFSDPVRQHGEFNTPSLLNSVYNHYQFWNGRAQLLEEIVQRSLDDEREKPASAPFNHVWGGVVSRLLQNESYREQFYSVFGSGPTQDNLGRALATYLRTLYSGNSIHDSALEEQKSRGASQLAIQDYRKVLTADGLKRLGRKSDSAEETAAELFKGYQLFNNLYPGRNLQCVRCHTGPLTTDLGFHNVGVDYDPAARPFPGRMAFAPTGQRNRLINGGFKTPSLREAVNSAPYFHNGQSGFLEEAIEKHVHPPLWNAYLDPAFPLKEFQTEDMKPLILYLHALKGDTIDPEFKSSQD